MSPAAELGSEAARARKAQEETANEIIEASFAYIVYQRSDTGQYVLTPDLNVALKSERAPTHDEVYGSMAVISKDLIGQQVAGMSAQANLQLNSFLAQQASGAADLDKMRAAGGLRVDGAG